MATPAVRRYAAMVIVAGMAFAFGWLASGRSVEPVVQAAPPVPATQSASPAADEPSDYSKRVVAYINGSVPITREELGEYLIARYGAEKLDLLINKKIIEHACAKKGINVTAADIEADFHYLIKNIGVSHHDFVTKVLQQYRKTEYEWKEDVIRPRLMLTQFCKDRIHISDDDLKKAFEAQHGEKVAVQIILYPPNQQKFLAQIYDRVRQSDKAFDEEARKMPDPNLAMHAGRIKPISRHSGLEDIEKVAFALEPGQISHVIRVPEGWLIMKCLGRVPADTAVKFEDVREKLLREVTEKKIAEEIPRVFAELAKEADPKRILAPERASRPEVERDMQQMLQGSPPR